MNDAERVLLISVHPRFATAILAGHKTVELRRQRVAVPEGTPVVLYATSPVMALMGTARVSNVETASPPSIWRRHRLRCGINRAEYDTYMDGAAQASALILTAPQALSRAVPLAHLRTAGGFHPPQSYRYATCQELHGLVSGHESARELLAQLSATREGVPDAQRPISGFDATNSTRSAALMAAAVS